MVKVYNRKITLGCYYTDNRTIKQIHEYAIISQKTIFCEMIQAPHLYVFILSQLKEKVNGFLNIRIRKT